MISIVIPTLNRPRPLVKLVQSLKAQLVNQDQEILVVYNQATEAAQSPLKNKPDIKILTAPSPGVNHARNWGAQNAQGEIILFIDDDCLIVDRMFVQKHIDAHLTDDKTPAFGGPYQLNSGSSLWDQVYHLNNLNWIESNKMGADRSFALLGGNTSYKASVFKKGMRFTEDIVYGGSETPLNTLLSLKYGPLGYLPDAPITHDTNLSFFKLIRKAYKQGLGAAIQTKLYGHQLRQTMEITKTHSLRYRLGLELYAFVFMLAYKARISQRQLLLVFFQELWTRYILQKKEDWTRRYQITQDKYVGEVRSRIIKVYWWQYTQIRHPLYMMFNRTFWFFYHTFRQTTGFLGSLLEPLNEEPKNFLDQISKRFIHITRKIAWLFLKSVGAR